MPYKDPDKRREANRLAQARFRGPQLELLKARVDAIKLERGCADCGYDEDSEALDFDHVRGVKLANVSVLVYRRVKWSRIQAEIDKCDVVCTRCHRIRTRQRGHPRPTPGEPVEEDDSLRLF